MRVDWWIILGVTIGSVLLTPVIRHYALKKNLLDLPNARSSHDMPTPRGGGLAIVASYLVGLIGLTIFWCVSLRLATAFAGAGVLVAAIGFWDDHSNVPPGWRIVVHFIAAAWALYFIGGSLFYVEFSLSEWFFNIFLLVSIVWVLNLYNFMDGIDMLAGAEAIFLGLSAALFFHMGGAHDLVFVALLLVASTAGFLVWNFPPARIFLGDIGSGFLGIIIGMLALAGIKGGIVDIWVWVILLGVFLVDATVTVGRRIGRGARCYSAHRSHAYQHAARIYGSHGKVTGVVTCINVFWLFPWAVAAWKWPTMGVLCALLAYIPLVWLAFRFNAGVNRVDSCTGE